MQKQFFLRNAKVYLLRRWLKVCSIRGYNRPRYKNSHFQNKAKSKTFVAKILVSMASHLALFWNGLFTQIFSRFGGFCVLDGSYSTCFTLENFLQFLTQFFVATPLAPRLFTVPDFSVWWSRSKTLRHCRPSWMSLKST